MDFRKIFRILALALFSVSVLSCSKSIGYSVVLWGSDENGLSDGDIVKVLVRSNITHTYIIDTGDGENREIPLWQLSEPESRKKARARAETLSQYANTFASVKLDGLPIRADSANTAKQIYRLREGEVIRVLYKGEGQAVTNGSGSMEGEWLRVLTSEGTQGWCFSHNLELYKSRGGERNAEESAKSEESAKDDRNFQILKSKRWYPAEYRELIKKKRIDLQVMSASFGFTFDEEDGRIVLATADEEKYWNFTGIRKLSGKQFQFDGANVNVTVKSDDEIVVQFMENGKPKNAVFASFGEDIPSLIRAEESRRSEEIERIVRFSQSYSSENYGTLEISGSGNFRFKWKDFSLLVPSVIPQNAYGSGSVAVELFISDSLRKSYDGVLTFDFGGEKVNFLYKIADGGLRLEDAVKAGVKDNVVQSRSPSPTVIFFEGR